MFAILAAICFAAKMLGGHLGSIDLALLGLLFVALHFVWNPLRGRGPWRD